MNKILICVFIFGYLVANGQDYVLDKKNSMIEWKGYGEIGGFVQEGTIELKEGILSFVDGRIESGIVVVDMKSIKCNEKDLTKHLRQEDFFYVKKYPVSKLKILTWEDGEVMAEITIRGVTNEIKVPIAVYDMGEQLKVGGTVSIDRTKFDIKFNSSTYFQDLGNYAIKNDFDLNFELVFER